ncbi:hypothetical protein BH09BAC1_BH09BAC1_26290 [soil metagenome]
MNDAKKLMVLCELNTYHLCSLYLTHANTSTSDILKSPRWYNTIFNPKNGVY